MPPPRKPKFLKTIAGTVRPCRERDEQSPLTTLTELPPPPDWLPNGHAAREYIRLGTILHRHGLLHEGNVGLVAVLATVHGKFVASLAGGMPLQAAIVAQYRALAGDLGLHTLAKVPSAVKATNPFAHYGKRPDAAGNHQEAT